MPFLLILLMILLFFQFLAAILVADPAAAAGLAGSSAWFDSHLRLFMRALARLTGGRRP
jgi:hypothetical protein